MLHAPNTGNSAASANADRYGKPATIPHFHYVFPNSVSWQTPALFYAIVSQYLHWEISTAGWYRVQNAKRMKCTQVRPGALLIDYDYGVVVVK